MESEMGLYRCKSRNRLPAEARSVAWDRISLSLRHAPDFRLLTARNMRK